MGGGYTSGDLGLSNGGLRQSVGGLGKKNEDLVMSRGDLGTTNGGLEKSDEKVATLASVI